MSMNWWVEFCLRLREKAHNLSSEQMPVMSGEKDHSQTEPPPPPRDLLDAADAPPPPPPPPDGRPPDLLDAIDSAAAAGGTTARAEANAGAADEQTRDTPDTTSSVEEVDGSEMAGAEAEEISAGAIAGGDVKSEGSDVSSSSTETLGAATGMNQETAEADCGTTEPNCGEAEATCGAAEMDCGATETNCSAAEAGSCALSETRSEERDSGDAELLGRVDSGQGVVAAETAVGGELLEDSSVQSSGGLEGQPVKSPRGEPVSEAGELGEAIAHETQETTSQERSESPERQQIASSEEQQELLSQDQTGVEQERRTEICEQPRSEHPAEPQSEQAPTEPEEKPSSEACRETPSEGDPATPHLQPSSENSNPPSSDAVTPAVTSSSSSPEPAVAADDASRRRRQPDLRAVPTRSNLKRKSDDPTGDSAAKRPRRSIQFDGVTVFYFPRAQGFTCIPSQGGSTLGMADAHSHVERFTLTDHVNEQRMAHRELLTRLRVKQRKLQRLAPFQPSASSSEESDAGSEEGSDLSDSELDVDSYFFLRPVSTRQRRALLRASGVRKIEPMEKDECRDIRTSREFCGCACKVVCRPDNCQCAGAGIKCQVDRQNFPCGCTRDGCQNPTGRIEFNPGRVRSHFVETIMREQPPASVAAVGPASPGPGPGGSAWASCGWQKAAGCAASPGQQYMAEQEFPTGGYSAGSGAGFADLSAPYQEDSSYSENSDGSSDGGYEATGAAAAAAAGAGAAAGYQPPQTQSHYSSFSFEGGLQNYGAAPGAAPYPGYPQQYPACQSYPAGSHYPPAAPQYSYPFNKYPTSGPGPGPGGGGAAVTAAAPPPPAGYPPSCGYPTYPTAAGCSYEPPPPVYAAAGPYDPAACSYPAAAPAVSFAGPPVAGAAAFPPEPAAPAPAAAPAAAGSPTDERKYTDLCSVPRPAGGQLESLADLLQDKFGGWAAGGGGGGGGGAGTDAPAPAAPAYCGTPPSEDSGVDVDEEAAKHAPPADENIGQIMKKTMVESVSA